jgi:hypothetical protein
VSTAIFRLQYEIMVHKWKLYKHENKLSPVPKKKSVRIQISWPRGIKHPDHWLRFRLHWRTGYI